MEHGQSSRETGVTSRCSLQVWRETIDEIEELASRKQIAAVKRLPFGHFLTAPGKNISGALVECLANRYDPEQRGFVLGSNVLVEFKLEEFSCVLGLKYAANAVHPKLVLPSPIVSRLFGGHLKNVKRKKIIGHLRNLAGKRDRKGDFARLYVLLAFNCLLFPESNQGTPAFVVHYVDNLEELWEYAWGDACYRYLEESIRLYREGRTERAINGCTFGLLVS